MLTTRQPSHFVFRIYIPTNILLGILLFSIAFRQTAGLLQTIQETKSNESMGLAENAKNFVSEKVANMPKPEATIKDVDLKGLGLDGVNLLARVSVSNPYKVPIPIGEIAYKVKSSGRIIASGSIPDPGSLKAGKDTMLDVAVKVAHSALVSLVRDIASDWDIDYELELGLIIDLPVIGNFTIPMSYAGEMKLPTFKDMFKGKSDQSAESSTTNPNENAKATIEK